MLLIGDKSQFAIESEIDVAYSRLSFRALGHFVIYINGVCYGLASKEATMLACSLGEVERRIEKRGKHTAPFSAEPDARRIMRAFRETIYEPEREGAEYFGLSHAEFAELIYATNIPWAPDGDEAFDDGSYVLQFDVGDQARLIAFKIETEEISCDTLPIQEAWLPRDLYYGILQKWRDAFYKEWEGSVKEEEQ